MSDEFATVLKTWSVEEAQLARIHLADEGIECHLTDNQTVAMDWGLANAMRGVSVVVKQADAERARQILEEAPSAGTFDFQAIEERSAGEIETEGTTDEPLELSDEAERQDGIFGPMRSMRSIAGPVVYFFLLLPLVIGVVCTVIQVFSRFTRLSY